MKFQEFINMAWNDHGTDSIGVASRLPDGIELLESTDQVPQLAQLALHVFGNHLGQWEQGMSFLDTLGKLGMDNATVSASIKRCKAAMEIGCGKRYETDDFDRSSRIQICALAAAALAEQGEIARSREYLELASALGDKLEQDDPANKTLAIIGNELACTLEAKESRSAEETEQMIKAAELSRKHWEAAGTWLEVERAEYRLANTYLKANRLDEATRHAQLCIEISRNNGEDPVEMFFGYEALALVERASGNSADFANAQGRATNFFDQLTENDKSWCKESLERLQ